MDPNPGELLHSSSSIVRVENPLQIYNLIESSEPFAPPDPQDIEEDEGVHVSERLSETKLDGDFLLVESTNISLVQPEHIGGKAAYDVHSMLVMADREIESDTHGFYDKDRLEQVRSALEAQGVRVDTSSINTGRLIVPGEGEEQIEINFGPSGDRMRASIESQPRALRAWLIGQAVKMAQRGNDQISLNLQKSSLGGFELGDEAGFQHNLAFYSKTYDKLLRALYREKGLPLPKNEVVLKSPVELNTRLKLG